MTNTELNTILTRLFFDYEENHFENTGVWPRRVNLVFGFADYAAALKDWEIADLLGTTPPKTSPAFVKPPTKVCRRGLKKT